MTLHQNLLEKRSQLYWLRFEPLIFRLKASCAIHYAMKYLVKIIIDVNIHKKIYLWRKKVMQKLVETGH